MNVPLSQLIADGTPYMGLAFGEQGSPVPVGELISTGMSQFSDQADQRSVGLLMTNDRPTVELILGAIATGTRLVSLPLPGRGIDVAAYIAFLEGICATEGLEQIIVNDAYADLLDGAGLRVRRHSELGRRPVASPSGDGFALVQFTSGSTGPPRPVVVEDEQLGANVNALLTTLQPHPGDALVSWLPLAHDMGLVGMLFTGIAGAAPHWAGQTNMVLMDPVAFLRDPRSWLRALHHWSASFTASPDFGYRLALRRAPGQELDLSSLRCAIVGGEIVRAETLHSFADALRPHSLNAKALCPAYGLAEAGLAVTLTQPDEAWRTRRVSTSALADARLEPCQDNSNTILVASGRPLPGYQVSSPKEPDAVSALRVRGPSLGSDGQTGKPLADNDGWYSTGDVGFVDDGWLYVCGRGDDYLVAHGRNIYAPAVEVVVGAVAGVREGRVTAVGSATGDWTIVAEPEAVGPISRGSRTLEGDIRRAAVAAVSEKPDNIVLVEPGSLPLTASGKLQRALVGARLAKNDLNSIDP